MNIEIADKALRWGELDVNLFGVEGDWYGEKFAKPLMFGLAVDKDYLWFVAGHQEPASLHPAAKPGAFVAELWTYDVAEFFLLDPASGKYLEFNLAANGAWWSAMFTGPRVRESAEEIPFPDVATYADLAPDGSWMAAAAIPLKELRSELNFGDGSEMNVAFIVGSPEQRFGSAVKLGGEAPNFHQPEGFEKVKFYHVGE
ncbi:MAG: hypothetical protein ACSHX6_06360 [Akkermansiaceae bacterium]